MKLLDQVASGCEPVRVSLAGGALYLAGASAFAEALAEAPIRYVLGDDVRDACRELAGSWPEGAAPKALSVPAGAMWLEWSDCDESGHARRTAILVRAETNGRRGTIHAFWEDASLGAELAQAFIRFDLDRREVAEDEDDCAICLVAPYSALHFEPDWADYFLRVGTPRFVQASVLRRCAAQLLPHFALLTGFFRLLAGRRDIAEKSIDRRALNRTRLRKGRPALLDHVEISLARKTGAEPGVAAGRAVRAPLARSNPPGLSHARI